MNDSDSLGAHTHEYAALLPWYLAGTLTPEETAAIDAHLQSCDACQKELRDMEQTKAALNAAISERRGPSPAVFTQVMARIQEETASPAATAIPAATQEPSLWQTIEQWFQDVFSVPWVPVLASLLIVGQSALLVTNLTTPPQSGGPAGTNQPVVTRGIPPATSPHTATRLRVTFVESATQGEIHAMLQQIHAQIIGGPSADGIYVLAIRSQDAATVSQAKQYLASQTGIIQSVSSDGP